MEAEKELYEKNMFDFVNPESGDLGTAVHDVREQGAEAIRQAKGKVVELYRTAEGSARDRYRKTAEAVGESYDKAMKYGRENPDKAFFLGLAVGIAAGILFGGGIGFSRARHAR